MVDILSQGEIDALLSALSSGELSAEDARRNDETGRLRAYDFRRAMRFSKDHLRSISRIYEQYARLLATYFAVQLRLPAQIQVESVTQLPGASGSTATFCRGPVLAERAGRRPRMRIVA